MIYWILSDVAGKHARRHDGDWEPLERRRPAGDEVTRFDTHKQAAAAAANLKKRGCHCKPLRQEFPVLFWRLPARSGESDMVNITEFPTKRAAAAWQKQALAEGCEVIECLGATSPKKRGTRS